MKDETQRILAARVAMHFSESAKVKAAAANTLSEPIAKAAMILADALRAGKKIMACGNGGSAADSQHFAAELVNRFETERPPFAAIALTTDSSILTSIGNDYDYKLVFSKQVIAIGQPGDVLLAISSSGNSANVLEAIVAAQKREMRVIALTGKGGGKTPPLLSDRDVHICVAHNGTGRIQEVHLLVLHCLCDAIDHQLLNKQLTS